MARFTVRSTPSTHSTPQPRLIFLRAKTIKNHLAPSRLPPVQQNLRSSEDVGCYRCKSSRCLSCFIITNGNKTFQSTNRLKTWPITSHLDCSSQYIVYLLTCPCNLQNVRWTIQTFCQRFNTHRFNIKNAIPEHSISLHFSMHHNRNPDLITTTY